MNIWISLRIYPVPLNLKIGGGGGHAKIDSIELSQYGEIWVDRLESKIIIKYTYSAFQFIK